MLDLLAYFLGGGDQGVGVLLYKHHFQRQLFEYSNFYIGLQSGQVRANIFNYQYKQVTARQSRKTVSMKIQRVITLILLVVISIALFFVFSYTKASPLTFLLGGLICLLVQAVFLCIFCFYKIQQTYRQSHTIHLKPNFDLNPAEQFPFEIIQPKEKLYFNNYTDEAKYFSQKNQLKEKEVQLANNDEDYFQELEINQPKAAIMSFLKEIQGYYYSLNFFTDVLINFGQDLKYIQRSSIFQKRTFFFAEFQKSYPPEIPMNELRENEMLVLESTNTNPLRTKGQSKKILFPTWNAVIDLLRFIGVEFQKIQAMRRSNSEMLTMIHKKVLEDFQLLQTKLVTVGKQLFETSKNLKDLRKDYAKYQGNQFNTIDENQPHVEMMHWFKKQFYAFRDLQRRIKQKQSTFKQKKQQKNYYQQKLSSFRRDSQKAFLKTVKTRYIALLDSYHITVDESIKKIQESFRSYQFSPVPPRPKVKQIVVEKNLNAALEAERKYQSEYLVRVEYFQNILKGMMVSIEGMGQFLNNLKSVFGEMIKNLKASLTFREKMAKYFTDLTRILLQRSLTFYNQVCQLVEVNRKMHKQNRQQLQTLRNEIARSVQKVSNILAEINIYQGPIRHKYQSARQQIESIYGQIQQKITKIQEFQSLYILHSGRIKKIIVIEFIDFLNKQRQFIAIGNIRQNFNTNVYGLIQQASNLDQTEIKNVLQQAMPNQMEIGSGSLMAENGQLSSTYLKFVNQFLFVCFTQWKTSNFFKHQILQELYIAFNKQPNESFSKIEVYGMQFSGLPPEIIWLKQLKTESSTQAFFDVHLAFKGSIKFNVNTIYKLIRDIPVEVTIQIHEFYCVMRFCFVPSYIGKGWFSFVGQPISKFRIVPSIGSYRFDIETLKTLISNFIMDKLKRIRYPIKQKISIPASKKDQDLANIQKRFKVIEGLETYR